MKKYLGFILTVLFFATPALVVAQENGSTDHAEVGIFAEYFRFSDPGPTSNNIGLGGRAAFNVRPSVQLEAEMGYDFERNYTSTFSNGITTANVQSRLRTLHGLFGPKFQTAQVRSAFRRSCFGFHLTNQGTPTGFANAVTLGSDATWLRPVSRRRYGSVC
jgi:hypothetical protein